MKSLHIEIEHYYNQKFVGRHFLKPSGEPLTLGNSREATIRLLGEKVSGIHATLEYTPDQGWVVADAGSAEGTWVQKKPILSHTVSEDTEVRIGTHELRMRPHIFEADLFHDETEAKKSKSGELFHQVVVRRHGFVVKTFLLPPTKGFGYRLSNNKKENFNPPSKEGAWVVNEFGPVVIQQRLTRSNVIEMSTQDRMALLMDPELRWPALMTLLAVFMLIGVLAFAPMRPENEMTKLSPEALAKYTKINMQAMEKVKKENAEPKTAAAQKQAATNPKADTNVAKGVEKPKIGQTGTVRKEVVIKNLRSAGLAGLIQRVAKRSNANADKVLRAGTVGGTTSAVASLSSKVGGVSSGKSGSPGVEKGFRLGQIGTAGKAGGSTEYRGVAGLATGTIGSSTVGLIDEEGEVQGGLDRDVIARVIKSQLGEIRYCYERQLSANPDLYGKVIVNFSINGNGEVTTSKVKNSSMNNSMVEGCMMRKIATWKFPKPKGGTLVVVTYPFLFKSTN